MTQTVNKTHANAMLFVVVLVSAFVLCFDQRPTSVLQVSAALMLAAAGVLYAHTQHRTGAYRLPLAGFAVSAVLYFLGSLIA
jgi:hypothetical protein